MTTWPRLAGGMPVAVQQGDDSESKGDRGRRGEEEADEEDGEGEEEEAEEDEEAGAEAEEVDLTAEALRGVAAMTSPITQAALNPLVLAMVRLGLGRILALPAQLLIHFISQIHNEIRCLYF